MLVQPATDQALPRAGSVEQVFPLDDLQRLFGAWRQALFVNRRTRGQPALQRLILLIGQPGHRQRHAFFRMRAGVAFELGGHRAQVFAVQTQDDVFRELGIRRQWRLVPKFEHARHQRSLAALGIEHRIEVFLLPGTFTEGIVKQSSGGCRLCALAIVDRHFARTTGRALTAAQIQLAGRVVAGVAGHALLGEDRLDITAI
ncbi:hypothetical protein D3C87_1243320 [compost metagenome]